VWRGRSVREPSDRAGARTAGFPAAENGSEIRAWPPGTPLARPPGSPEGAPKGEPTLMQPDKKNERDNKDRKDHEQQPKTARPPRELDDRQQQKPGQRANEPRRPRS
jgi:hypothetical protein